MPRGRLELPRAYAHHPLKMACLPIPPPRHWQGRQDSNPRPAVLETAALPTELRPYSHHQIISNTPGATRTRDTRFRKPLLYPPELQGQCGDRGIRTPNLCDANAALSLLSYIPADSILAAIQSKRQVPRVAWPNAHLPLPYLQSSRASNLPDSDATKLG